MHAAPTAAATFLGVISKTWHDVTVKRPRCRTNRQQFPHSGSMFYSLHTQHATMTCHAIIFARTQRCMQSRPYLYTSQSVRACFPRVRRQTSSSSAATSLPPPPPPLPLRPLLLLQLRRCNVAGDIFVRRAR